MGVPPLQSHGAPLLVSCSPVSILKSLVLKKKFCIFIFAPDSTNDAASPGERSLHARVPRAACGRGERARKSPRCHQYFIQAETVIGYRTAGGKVGRMQHSLTVSECHSAHDKEETDFNSIHYEGGTMSLPRRDLADPT